MKKRLLAVFAVVAMAVTSLSLPAFSGAYTHTWPHPIGDPCARTQGNYCTDDYGTLYNPWLQIDAYNYEWQASTPILCAYAITQAGSLKSGSICLSGGPLEVHASLTQSSPYSKGVALWAGASGTRWITGHATTG